MCYATYYKNELFLKWQDTRNEISILSACCHKNYKIINRQPKCCCRKFCVKLEQSFTRTISHWKSDGSKQVRKLPKHFTGLQGNYHSCRLFVFTSWWSQHVGSHSRLANEKRMSYVHQTYYQTATFSGTKLILIKIEVSHTQVQDRRVMPS